MYFVYWVLGLKVIPVLYMFLNFTTLFSNCYHQTHIIYVNKNQATNTAALYILIFQHPEASLITTM